jgi:hypothetical protein
MQNYSRRQVAASFLALLGCRFHLNGQSGARERAGPSRSTPANTAEAPQRAKTRKYRADAAILFLGMTIYRRAAVGDGEAAVEESGEGPGRRCTLFFAAGSDPKRARGLTRLGWIRESVSGPEAAPSQIGYTGVLSSSPEETLDHARQSVPSSDRVSFGAVMGSNSAGRSRSATAHFEFDAKAVWSDRALINQAHSLFDGNVNWRETSWPDLPDQAPPTFLYQLVTLLRKRTHSAAGRYVYSEQEYLLTLERRQPGGDRERLVTVRGKIRNLRTGRETSFRLWLEDDSSIVPVRFEFQPRSFLKLTFEAAKSASSRDSGLGTGEGGSQSQRILQE